MCTPNLNQSMTMPPPSAVSAPTLNPSVETLSFNLDSLQIALVSDFQPPPPPMTNRNRHRSPQTGIPPDSNHLAFRIKNNNDRKGVLFSRLLYLVNKNA
jgi:hypothetical protein